jgi:endoglucanase
VTDTHDALYALLQDLTALDGVAGHETAVVRRLVELLTPSADELTVDPMGNIYAVRRAARPGPTLAVMAHSDEIGMSVKAVDSNGFIRFHTIGGTPPPVLPARVVRIGGRHLGVTGIKAGHYMAGDEATRVRSAAESYIDVGARSAAEVAAMGIRVGDPIVFVAPLQRLPHRPDLVFGRAVDNRISCAILVHLFQERVTPPVGTLVGVVAVQEEVGLRGARVAAQRLQPDAAFVVDTMPAAGPPDMRVDVELNALMGAGPAFQLMSRDYLMPPRVKDFLVATAEAEGIPYQLVSMHTSNTDAAAVHLAGRGVPTGVISLPRRYSHAPVEMLDLNDAVHAASLLRAIIARMDRLDAIA